MGSSKQACVRFLVLRPIGLAIFIFSHNGFSTTETEASVNCLWHLDHSVPFTYTFGNSPTALQQHAFAAYKNSPNTAAQNFVLDVTDAFRRDHNLYSACQHYSGKSQWCSPYHTNVLLLKRGDNVEIRLANGIHKVTLEKFIGAYPTSHAWKIQGRPATELRLPFYTSTTIPLEWNQQIQGGVRALVNWASLVPKDLNPIRLIRAGTKGEYAEFELEPVGGVRGDVFLETEFTLRKTWIRYWTLSIRSFWDDDTYRIVTQEEQLRVLVLRYWQWIDERVNSRPSPAYDFNNERIWASYLDTARRFRLHGSPPAWALVDWE